MEVLGGLSALSPASKARVTVLAANINSKASSCLRTARKDVLSRACVVPRNTAGLAFSCGIISRRPVRCINSSFSSHFAACLSVINTSAIVLTRRDMGGSR